MAFEPDWNRTWAGTENGVRFTSGGLSDRLLFLESRWKIRRSLGPAIRFRTEYVRLQSLLSTEDLLRVGFEARVKESPQPWFIELWTDPGFEKRAIDFGMALKRWEGPANRLELGLEAMDLLANRISPEATGTEDPPGTYSSRPYRVSFAYYRDAGPGWRVRLDASRYLRPSQQRIPAATESSPEYWQRRFERCVSGEVVHGFSPRFLVGCEFDRTRTESERLPLDPGNGRPGAPDASSFREDIYDNRVKPYYLRPLDSRRFVLLGIEFRTARWTRSLSQEYAYRRESRIPFLIVRTQHSPRTATEWGLLRETYEWSLDQSATKGSNSRMLVALTVQLTPRAGLRLGTGVDLDRPDRDRRHYYDKAFLNLLVGID
jgi:hypothetical protein